MSSDRHNFLLCTSELCKSVRSGFWFNEAVTVRLEQHEFDALVSFDFNTGGIYRANLTKQLNTGNRVKAAQSF